MRYTKDIPVLGEYDVVVCGGGPTGFPAAIAAARLGVTVAVVERHNMPGGALTAGRNNQIALFNAGDRPVIRGIGWEFVERLAARGDAHIPHFAAGIPHWQQGVSVNVPMAARLMDEMCAEDGVALYLLSTLVDMVRGEDGWLVVCADKRGLWALKARRVVDGTGDGDACVFAGAGYELGDEQTGELQPGTLGFYVDYDEAAGFDREAIAAAYGPSLESGELKRHDVWPATATPALVLQDRGVNIGHVAVEPDYDSKRTEMEVEGRASVARLQRWLNKYSPQSCAVITATAAEVWLRETRRIRCRHRITAQEYLAGTTHNDDICHSYYPIDLHRLDEDGAEGSLFNIHLDGGKIPSIPYRALQPAGVEDILVAGRCVGGDRLAQSAYRVKASCMAMGQVAGAAAALSVNANCPVAQVDLGALWQALRAQRAIVPGDIE